MKTKIESAGQKRTNVVTQMTYKRRYWKYGLTLAAFNDLLDEQDGRCVICDMLLDTERSHGIHVDHCHKTNMIRGLLCGGCNVWLGHVEARFDVVTNYLKSNAAIPIVRPSTFRTRQRQPPPRQHLSELGAEDMMKEVMRLIKLNRKGAKK